MAFFRRETAARSHLESQTLDHPNDASQCTKRKSSRQDVIDMGATLEVETAAAV
jgi:hypothetical protein